MHHLPARDNLLRILYLIYSSGPKSIPRVFISDSSSFEPKYNFDSRTELCFLVTNGFPVLNEFQRNFFLFNNSNIGCSLYHWWSVYAVLCCGIQERSVGSIGQFEPRTPWTWFNHHRSSNNDHRRIFQLSNVSLIISSD